MQSKEGASQNSPTGVVIGLKMCQYLGVVIPEILKQ